MQSPEHSMPTHAHKQTHTNTHRHNAKQSHTPTHSLALWLLKWILLFPRLECLMFDSRQGRGPNPRVPSRPLQALLRTIPPEQVGRGWRGLFFCQRNAQRGTISKHTLPLSSASISVNYSLVSSGIIQTASANVNELLFAYLFFSLLKCH